MHTLLQYVANVAILLLCCPSSPTPSVLWAKRGKWSLVHELEKYLENLFQGCLEVDKNQSCLTSDIKWNPPPQRYNYTFCWLVTLSCLTHLGPHGQLFCDPIDCSPPGSSVHGIFPGKNTRQEQEWVAIFSPTITHTYHLILSECMREVPLFQNTDLP